MIKNLSGYVLIIFLFISGCTFHQLDNSGQSIQHVVIVWFKSDTSEETIKTIIEETRRLKQIPGILGLSVGHSVPSQRKIVDDSFDIGIVMRFPDKTTMDRYINHPQHIDFVKTWVKPHIRKIIVYDILDTHPE
ncbi:MAG: Dabb family protein [Gammaproteobacteria bacterium]|nr:Dabb family protein [Gammaproteobacteria bacterium]MDH5593786.1 Dabb family protein [Gammaproteobacteria bacterium]MDH5614614.1 Dabb family protein [Gammaproteobacteria bacterium]